MMSPTAALLLLCLLPAVLAEDPYEEVIEDVSKDKLENYVDELEYVAVIFYTKNCKACDDAMAELEYIDDDVGKYGIKMVKINNAEAARENGVDHFPTLILWRKEVPILYEGKYDDKDILYWIIHNKQSSVVVLHDDNFEKVTEIGSGMGTGDWFIMFFEPNDKKCTKVMPTFEAIGSRLTHKMSVGKVDVEANDYLDTRFSITEVPTILFFRQGKMYRFNQETFDTQSLVSFASRWYKTAKAERVPKADPEDKSDEDEWGDSTKNFIMSVAAASLALVVAATTLIVIFIGLGYIKINQEKLQIQADIGERRKQM